MTLDHIIPLNKGGISRYNNYVVACQKCNSSKRDKNIYEWCAEQNLEIPKIVDTLLKLQGQQIKLWHVGDQKIEFNNYLINNLFVLPLTTSQ